MVQTPIIKSKKLREKGSPSPIGFTLNISAFAPLGRYFRPSFNMKEHQQGEALLLLYHIKLGAEIPSCCCKQLYFSSKMRPARVPLAFLFLALRNSCLQQQEGFALLFLLKIVSKASASLRLAF